ncbi:MAG: type I glyceraldehyde-3-phosphate dehydrogenase [Desulfovibrio sp.]|nr:type I glyceraldehyde-3-phosphate dehydrogenase [Desulfovibrio sp.]
MKKTRVAINGFGRIGRQVFRALHQNYRESVEVVAVNDLFDTKTNFHLLTYDSNYGRAAFVPVVTGDTVSVDEWAVQSLALRDPRQLPWKNLGVDVVVESTGIFRTGPEAKVHLDSGARKVIITAPTKDEDIMIVLGVNQEKYDPDKHHIISNASCTTNCLAPVAKVLEDNYGIENGLMTTIHSYTNDQRILDLSHKDLRRSRAAALNIIPTSTGAAQAVAKAIPSLKGKFTGYSLRVPTPTVSVVDFTAVLKKDVDTVALHRDLKAAEAGPMKGILGTCDLPLVSSDFKGDPRSSVVDLENTYIHDKRLAKVVSWYDNEWGYSCRVTDLIDFIASKGL